MWANDWTFNLLWRQKFFDRKLERPPIKFNIYGMIDTSRKVISLIFGIPSTIKFCFFSEGIYAFDVWGITCCNSREAMEIRKL